jgi:hypothetical protein
MAIIYAVSGGQLFSLEAISRAPGDRWLWLFENRELPQGTLLLPPLKMAAGASRCVRPFIPLRFVNGIVAGVSSAADVFTPAADEIDIIADHTGLQP